MSPISKGTKDEIIREKIIKRALVKFKNGVTTPIDIIATAVCDAFDEGRKSKD